jgi:hypothetical protein
MRHALPSLGRLEPEPPARWPRLSVVVPACDEVSTLGRSVRALLAAGYPDLEIVVVDDRSTDGTSALIDRLAGEDGRIRAVHVTELPPGWLGKVHAMHVGTGAATGEWLLYCDADAHIAPQALSRIVAWCESRGIDFVSALPAIERAGAVVSAAVAVVMRLIIGGARVWAVDDPGSGAVFGLGVFLLARRAAFERTEGFSWLRLEVADDMGLALMMKRSGARCAVLHAASGISVAPYPSAPAMIRALEKNGYAIMGRCSALRTVAFAAVVAIFELGFALALLPLGAPWLPWLGLAALGLAAAATALSAGLCRLPAWIGWLFPLGVGLLVAAMLRSAFEGWRQGGVVWRGTLYRAQELRGGIRVRFPE